MPAWRVFATLLLALMPGCGAAFHRGDLAHDRGARRIGCIEASARRGEDAWDRRVRNDGASAALVEISFGNGCAEAVEIDLSEVAVSVRDTDGTTQPLLLFDPNDEVRPALLDADTRGTETLRYDWIDPLPPDAEICVALAEIAAPQVIDHEVAPVCFRLDASTAR